MKKTIAYLLTLLMLLGLMAGCAQNSENTEAPGPEGTDASVSEPEDVAVPGDSQPSNPTVDQATPAETAPEPTKPVETLPEIGTDPGGYGQIF